MAGGEQGLATPVMVLLPRIGNRLYNALVRQGIGTVEQLAATSDMELLSINVIGFQSLYQLRQAVVAFQVGAPVPAPHEVTLSVEQVQELSSLLIATTTLAYAQGRTETARQAEAFLALLGGREPVNDSTGS